ncbi:hypothetical protein F5Y15DRAFT_414004 [Xylariaceae sp. FL0016]|nr:hypothetical protein F5Y15DRAFT_414004 [Xylariaceae sp. FL0016]
MASQQPKSQPTLSEIHLSLFRPAVLQILRAQGYYGSTPSTVDTLTELAANYMALIAEKTRLYAQANSREDLSCSGPTVTDVRLALEDCGALYPEREFVSQELSGEEDLRGVDDFLRWARGKKNMRIRKIAGVGNTPLPVAEEGGVVEEQPSDYLDALMRKHNRSDHESKYAGTILGHSIDHGDVMVEGGADPNQSCLSSWVQMMKDASQRPPTADGDAESERPPSSGLSSLTDGDVDMLDFGEEYAAKA